MSLSDASTKLPTVAVLLAAYNGMRWIEEQLVSIFSQPGINVHVFVSVDYSSDGVEKWLERYALGERRLSVLSYGKKYGSAARNFFRLLRDVDVTGFDYVAFSDQDDIWCEGRLQRGIERLSEGYAGYSSDVMAFWSDGRRKIIKKSQQQRQWDFLFESPGPGCTFIITPPLIVQVQSCLRDNWALLQRIEFHDWFVYGLARAGNFPWVIDNYAGILYRQHQENAVGANAGIAAFRERVRQVSGGAGFAQAALLAEVIGLKNEPFVKSWTCGSRLGFLRLAFKAGQCRRRYRDRFFFFLLCLQHALLAPPSSNDYTDDK